MPLVEADTRGDGLRDVVALDEGVHRLLAHAHRAVITKYFIKRLQDSNEDGFALTLS